MAVRRQKKQRAVLCERGYCPLKFLNSADVELAHQLVQGSGLVGQFAGNGRAFLGSCGVVLDDPGYFLDSVFHGDDHFRLLGAGQCNFIHQHFNRLDAFTDDLHRRNRKICRFRACLHVFG